MTFPALTGSEIVRLSGSVNGVIYPEEYTSTQLIANLANGSGTKLPRTPESSGITIDRTGTVDATSALNAFFQSMITHGDEGYLGAGIFKTSGELAIVGTSTTFGGLRGAGSATIIKPAAGNYHGLRINIDGALNRKSPVSGITIIGQASSLPTNGKAGFILDATTLMPVYDVEVSGFDIGFDLINNCYNSSFYNPSVPRFDGCNCGLNLRSGLQSGSDISIYNSMLFGHNMAVNIEGGGGGFHFFGGEWSARNVSPTISDDLGVLTMGKVYVADGSGSVTNGPYQVQLNGISMEGWQDIWAIRTWREFELTLSGCTFQATAATHVARGFIKMNDPQNFRLRAMGCRLGQGTYLVDPTSMVQSAGSAFSAAGTIDEDTWSSETCVCNGQTTGGDWFRMIEKGWGLGFSRYVDVNGFSTYLLSIHVRLRAGSGNILEKSLDDGANWTTVT